MNCRACTDWLLEADPAAIRKALGGPWGAGPDSSDPGSAAPGHHAATCKACRMAAVRVLEQVTVIDAELRRAGSSIPIAVAARRATATATGRRRRAAGTRTALAVAAGLLAVVALNDLERGRPVGPAPVVVVAAPTLYPEVEVDTGHSVAVFETDDDDVVVFWFYEGRGQ